MQDLQIQAFFRHMQRAVSSLVLIAFLSVCGSGQASATEEPCALHDWLVWLYDSGESLPAARSGPAAEAQAVNLAKAITSANPERLSRSMVAAGLGQDTPTVRAYLVLLKARLISFVHARSAASKVPKDQHEPHPAALGMAGLVQNLECDAEPDWSPDRQTKARDRRAGNDETSRLDLRAGAIAAGALVGMGLVAAAVILLGRRVLISSDRRRSTRHPCRMSCSLETSGDSQTGIAVDISRTGAKLRLTRNLLPQSHCTFEAGGLRLGARVVWSNTHFAGIVFSSPMDPHAFETLLRQHQWDAPAASPLPELDLPNIEVLSQCPSPGQFPG